MGYAVFAPVTLRYLMNNLFLNKMEPYGVF